MKRRNTIRLLASGFWLLASGFWLISCTGNDSKKNNPADVANHTSVLPPAPVFNEDSACAFVKTQVDFGPRVPGTQAHAACASYLVEKFKSYELEVMVQNGSAVIDGKRTPIKNIIASYLPDNTTRILLAAHWDTRSVADRDTANKDKPIDGANDGASGVAVLMEIARLLGAHKPELGVDLVLFDMEDQGDDYCLGSAYWAKNPHKPGYVAQFGILLDMVGAIGATFPVEGHSRQYAQSVVKRVWSKAAELGYPDYFVNKEMQEITDDHYNINTIANIPCIDIIHMDLLTGDFGPFHHRHSDNLSIIDKKTLKAVGQTVLEVVWNEQNKKPL